MSETADEAAGEWRRTSPLGLAVSAIQAPRAMLLPAAAVFFGSGGLERGMGYALGVLAVLAGVSFAFSYLGWRKFRYRVGESDIRAEWGLLSRAARSVPYERIQDVSLEQALIPRLFGLAVVRFETGAGGNDELKLAYVPAAQGEALRETVRARRLEEPAAPGEERPGAGQTRPLFAMDSRRLLTFGLFEFSLVILAVLAGAAQQFDFLLPFDIWNFDEWLRLFAGQGHWLAALGLAAQVAGALLALATLALAGLATGIARTVLRDHGFLLEDTPRGLRRRRGLLTRTDTVMPLHRVQALKVTTGIVRRHFGWHGLHVVSLAHDAKSESHVAVPFGTMEEIDAVARVTGFALPGADAEWRGPSARRRFDRAVLAAVPLLPVAAAAPLLASLLPGEARFPALLPSTVLVLLAGFFALREHFLWRFERHALDGEHLYVRRGWLAPRLDIASRVKLQSVEIAQGPIARRRGYADLRFGVAGGTLEIPGIPLEQAREIRAAVLASIAGIDFSRLPG